MTTRELSFVVHGTPIPQGSMKGFAFKRRTGTVGVALTSDNKKTRPWKDSVASAAREAWDEAPTDDAISLTMEFAFMPPKSSRVPHKTTKPDIDKLARAVMDALTGVVYRDDSQVVALNARKVFTFGSPGVTVRVETIANAKLSAKEARQLTFGRKAG